jgi:hypothetical protein
MLQRKAEARAGRILAMAASQRAHDINRLEALVARAVHRQQHGAREFLGWQVRSKTRTVDLSPGNPDVMGIYSSVYSKSRLGEPVGEVKTRPTTPGARPVATSAGIDGSVNTVHRAPRSPIIDPPKAAQPSAPVSRRLGALPTIVGGAANAGTTKSVWAAALGSFQSRNDAGGMFSYRARSVTNIIRNPAGRLRLTGAGLIAIMLSSAADIQFQKMNVAAAQAGYKGGIWTAPETIKAKAYEDFGSFSAATGSLISQGGAGLAKILSGLSAWSTTIKRSLGMISDSSYIAAMDRAARSNRRIDNVGAGEKDGWRNFPVASGGITLAEYNEIDTELRRRELQYHKYTASWNNLAIKLADMTVNASQVDILNAINPAFDVATANLRTELRKLRDGVSAFGPSNNKIDGGVKD